MTPGGVAVTGSNGGTFIVQPDGSYVFVPGTSFQHLPEGQTATTTISYVVTDPSGATSTATVEVTVVGVNDPARITPAQAGDDAGSVTEDKVSTANGKLNVVDPDDGQSFFVAVADRPGTYGTLDRCQWQLGLQPQQQRSQGPGPGRGEKLTETFTVTTADGTTGTVTITINGTNDVPTISGRRRRQGRRRADRHRPADQDRCRRQRQAHLVRQRRRPGSIRQVHGRPERQVDVHAG